MPNYNKYTKEQQAKIDQLQQTCNEWESTYDWASRQVTDWQKEAAKALPHYRRAENMLCNYLNECDRLLKEKEIN
jgi:hypothetical protein